MRFWEKDYQSAGSFNRFQVLGSSNWPGDRASRSPRLKEQAWFRDMQSGFSWRLQSQKTIEYPYLKKTRRELGLHVQRRASPLCRLEAYGKLHKPRKVLAT